MEINERSKNLLAYLILALSDYLKPTKTMAVDLGFGAMFSHSSLSFDTKLARGDPLETLPADYDLEVANPPFGESVVIPGSLHRKGPASVALIESLLPSLSETGLLLINVEPGWAYGFKGNALQDLIAKRGFSIQAFLITNAGFYLPWTAIRAPFLLIGRGAVERQFAIKIDTESEIDHAIQLFVAKRMISSSIAEGTWVVPGTFGGPAQYEVGRQIEGMQSDYKLFQLKPLPAIAISINSGKTGMQFAGAPNTIYIPSIGSLDVISDLSKATKKHQNYFQVQLDPTLVEAEYLKAYLSTELGQLSLSALISDGFIPRINKSTLMQLQIPLPELAVQRTIASTIAKLDQITHAINGFANNLSINPVSAIESAKKVDSMLEVIDELADSDRVANTIRAGESKTVEFKQTFSLDVRTNNKERHIEDAAIKSLAAFLNSDGGTLLVGVDDAGAIKGLSLEIERFHQSTDKFLRHVKNLIKDRIGEQFYPYLESRLVAVGGDKVLMVACTPSRSAVYVDDKDFFVRTNPATDKLEGPKLVEYVKNHFGN